MGSEFKALTLMRNGGVKSVPQPLRMDTAHNCALYGWINGDPVGNCSDKDIADLAEFLTSIQKLRDHEDVVAIGLGSDSCVRPMDALDQLQRRVDRLCAIKDLPQELTAFLDNRFIPTVKVMSEKARAALQRLGLETHTMLPKAHQTLSPSDFGFHNALRIADGTLTFLDFEYFGWDDPVKAVSDAMLHPGSMMSESQAEQFFSCVSPVFSANDDTFIERFEALFNIFALLWCLIILNEFLPERWERRRMANMDVNRGEVQRRQLAKAQRLFDRIFHAHDS